ncbi:MAG: hypothetical protein IPN94_25595 [Sphingobacteriales bacterium]|nr:hypothetical protein [Sphingobacteriales bacterium]
MSASPTTTITGTNTYCVGDAATSLTASGGSTYLWDNGTASASITPTTNTAGNTTYTVTVTNASGCTDTESVGVTVADAVATIPRQQCQHLLVGLFAAPIHKR